MVELRVPEASADATEHADWLELHAVISGDSVTSPQDLATALKRTGSSDAVDDFEDSDPIDSAVEHEDEALERIADEAFEILGRRRQYLGETYPFSLNDVITAESQAARSPYTFLTALTYFGSRIDSAPEPATSLFELLSTFALEKYLGGHTARSYHFGFPRVQSPSSFRDALNELCIELGEGTECSIPNPHAASVKDAKLDLVGWIPFYDDRPNQLIVMGQCTTAKAWDAKINELQPFEFCHIWMRDTPALQPLSAFFVPTQISDHEWLIGSTSDQRILFDRLRITHLLGELDASLAQRCALWTRFAISQDHIC